ncbi:MAG: T9SS type A sorting domain-containing protein, partial [Bacteroidales bacterium]|nr:T9SS type A sorting domain-containing protein [Bacteroidales bacterium]
ACDSYTWNGTPYTTSGTYTYAYNATNGCPSVDTLNLTVNNSTTGSENVTACNYYLWNGNAYTQSGTYTSTLTGANGCDSVATLNLTIGTVAQSTVTATSCNAYTWNGNTYTQSGAYTHTFTGTAGCDSVVTLLLTISQAMSTTLAVTACDSYTWNGVTYANSGNYSNTYSATNGCDSIVTLALTINNSTASTVNATACDSYTWRNGQTYTASTNTPTTTIVNAAGCDSVITLHLTINNSTTNTINATACDSYTWNNTNYTTSGNYTQTYPAANGCDSTVTLNLTIQNATNATVSVTACDSYTWINGQTYTTSTNTPTVTLVNANGCDSIVTLNLTINNGATGVDNQTACESYTWIDGQTYTVSTNTPTYTLTAANGCDSVVTLNLTVNYGTTGVDNQTACGSYTWIDGETYTASTNTPTYTLPAANGCDSVVTLNLTINNNYDIIDQVSACDGFIWIDNVNYTESTNTPTVTLQAMNGCDSVVTLHLTINHSVETYDTVVVNSTDLPYYYGDYTFNETGDYALGFTTVNGCDSTVYLHFEVNVVGINTVSVLDDLVVYPNPTRGGVTLTADKVVKVEVLDIVGRCVATFEGTNTFDISNLAQGSYTLRITLPEGVTVRKVVKK